MLFKKAINVFSHGLLIILIKILHFLAAIGQFLSNFLAQVSRAAISAVFEILRILSQFTDKITNRVILEQYLISELSTTANVSSLPVHLVFVVREHFYSIWDFGKRTY